MLYANKWSPNYFDINRKSFFPALNNIIIFSMSRVHWIKIPIFSSFFQSGAYSFLLLFTINFVLFKKEYEMLAPLFFLVGLWISVVLAPIGYIRY